MLFFYIFLVLVAFVTQIISIITLSSNNSQSIYRTKIVLIYSSCVNATFLLILAAAQ
jgi:hypothetical protein